MDAFTLLIADSDESFRRALFLALQDSFYIRTCETGSQALRLLRVSPVHILVVDLMLPELDGLALVQTLFCERICPAVLAVSPVFPPDTAARMKQLDIRHCLRKPCSTAAAVARIRELRREVEAEGLIPRRARQLLCQMDMLPKYDGYAYTLHALTALTDDADQTITKHLYQDTAKAFGSTAEQVERDIRTLLEHTWDHFPNGLLRRTFPCHTKRPSNGDFLQKIALELRKNLE